MYQTKTTNLVSTKQLAYLLSLSTIAIGLPFFVHNQLITGPIINAVLVLSVTLLGLRTAVFLSLIPSVVALSSGLLPALLAPIVPFIMIANVLLVSILDYSLGYFKSRRTGFIVGVIGGSVLKFLFLYLSVGIISSLLIKAELISKIAQIMSSMQLFTALAGGVIATVILVNMKFFTTNIK